MAARRISKSSVDWASFYQKVPAREREMYRALKNRSDYFVNKVHANPESLGKIDFSHYKTALPGLKMVDDFEKAYQSLNIPYPKDKQNLLEKIKQDESKSSADSQASVKQLEEEKRLSAQYLEKLKELPKREDFTMEMLNDYFPWTQVKGENPKIFPFTKMYQPENLELNDSRGINNLFRRIGMKTNF